MEGKWFESAIITE